LVGSSPRSTASASTTLHPSQSSHWVCAAAPLLQWLPHCLPQPEPLLPACPFGPSRGHRGPQVQRKGFPLYMHSSSLSYNRHRQRPRSRSRVGRRPPPYEHKALPSQPLSLSFYTLSPASFTCTLSPCPIIGTGTDLARALGWGGGHRPMSTRRSLHSPSPSPFALSLLLHLHALFLPVL
jgi:hypothetical protein